MLRRLLNPAAIFGAIIILICWGGLAYQLHLDRAEAIDLAIERGDRSARLFEKDTIRLLRSVDTILLMLRQAYEDNPEQFDFDGKTRQAILDSNVVTQLGLVTSDGYLTRTTAGPLRSPIYVGDVKHFTAQADASDDKLVIGDAITLRSTGRFSIPIARRLRTRDGHFAGIISGQIDPGFAEQFAQTLKLGPDSTISVWGLDRVMRASHGFKKPPSTMMPVALAALSQSACGHFWGGGVSDGIARLVTYRTLKDFPLVIGVGETETHVFADFQRRRLIYGGIAIVLTMLTMIFVANILLRQSALERVNGRLSQVNGRFNAALSHMLQGISMYDGDHRLVVWNEQFAKLYGFPPTLVTAGRPFRDLLGYLIETGMIDHDIDSCMALRSERLSKERAFLSHHVLADGRTIAVTNHAMENGGWVATHEDITDRKNSEIRIEQLAHFDALTGLANRNLFKQRVEEALTKYQQQNAEFVVFLLDLDAFKGVNDRLGHQAGDALLKEVADRIRTSIRDVDVAARLGGDEFAVIVASGTGEPRDNAQALAARLIEAISAPYKIDGHTVVVSCSIGIALVPAHGERIDEVLRNADLALYKSKNAGRNCFCFFSAEMKAEAELRNALEMDLREAIWADQLEIHYQPVVDFASGCVVAVEALARWCHKSKGAIPPSEFIPVAEKAGLIVELGNWIMLRACQDAMRMPKDIKVAVNLSPVQFAKSSVLEAAIFALANSGLSVERLEFEITEGVLMEEAEQNLATLRQIKNLGVSIALDDFGVGFSSLSYLTAFPFDKVKIDKSFIDRLNRPESVAVISSIVHLANSLNLVTVAEGIETQDQLDRICPLGLKLGQGFVFKAPVPASQLQFDSTYVIAKTRAA